MSEWMPALSLDPTAPEPIYLQIARGISEAIASGRLAPGSHLPGTRALSAHLAVNRNTVVAAFQELQAEGWIESRSGGGSFVAPHPPSTPTCPAGSCGLGIGLPVNPPPGTPFDGRAASAPLSCLTTEVDPRLLPTAALARAYQRALRTRDRSVFAGIPADGLPRFREALALMLRTAKGLAVTAEQVIVGHGLTESLALVCRTLLPPGAPVAVEHLGSPGHWECLRNLGHPLLPIQVDAQGAQPDSAREALDQGARMILLTPLRQYPTTVSLSRPRRAAFLALAQARKVPLLEIDLDPGFQYDGPPALPLAAEDTAGCVLYLGAFSRALFPTLPLAYLAAPPALVPSLSAWRVALGGCGDPFLQRAMTELLEDGELNRHLHRLRRTCLERRAFLEEALRTHLQSHLQIRPPEGGLAFWLPAQDARLDVDAWAGRARAEGTAFLPGGEFTLDRSPLAALRIGFAARSLTELDEAVQRLARTLPSTPEPERLR